MKFEEYDDMLDIDEVAPLAGAWIEIFSEHYHNLSLIVAPLAGAWIEIRETLALSR